MDSESEAEAKSPSGRDNSEEPREPSSAAEIENFGQMVKMAPKLEVQVRSMSLPELAAVCQAAARVKFYDSSLFDPVKLALQRHLRGRSRHKPADIVAVLASLASMNSCDKALFELIETALADYHETQIDAGLRKQILQAVKTLGHKSETTFLKTLAEREANERYSAACLSSATQWQKRDENQKQRTYWWS